MKRLVAFLLLGLTSFAGASLAKDPPAKEAPTAAATIEAAGFAAEDVGYLVVDLADGKVVAEHNPDRLFIPASVAKIPAIAAALEILGGDYRFATTLLAAGDVTDGTLAGSLTLRGGGDPVLTGDDLRAMAKELAAAGVKRVEGRFIFDASALVDVPQINALQPEAASYNTGVSALSLNFNRARLIWRNGASPSASAVTVSEQLTLPMEAIGLAFADGALPGPFVRTETRPGERWLLSPELSASGEDWIPVGNAALITAEAFRALAAAEGVDLPEPEPGVAPDGGRELVRHDSPPLAEIAEGVLHYSNNLSAELIGLVAARALTGQSFSLEDSALALTGWWKLRRPDDDWTGYYVENHSGLSSRSRTTPRQIVRMLEEAAETAGGADFHGLLRPIQWKGVEGSASVKTGTMSYVRGLAGYIDTAAGNRLAFAIFFNDSEKRAALDAAFDPYARGIDPKSRRWRNRAVVLEQKLTTGWAKSH